MLWLDDGDLDADAPRGGGAHVTLFVSECDRYIDGRTIYADAVAATAARRAGGAGGAARRALRAVLWEGADHGDFLACEARRREVVDCVLAGGAEGG